METGAYPIEVRDVKKSFGSQQVLKNVGLKVKHGQTVSVLGKSGTGKSVLLKLIIGLQKPDSGDIEVDGKNVPDLQIEALNALRKKIGFLFQQAALYDSLTVRENVEFPLVRHAKMSPQERKQRSEALLRDVGMEEDLDKMPSQISGGMQKRVGLARALALEPEILLLDEPTSGLDPITAAEIGKLILDIKKKRATSAIVVTHDVRAASMFSDQMVLLHEGKIIAEGTLEELQSNKNNFVKQFLDHEPGGAHV